MTRVISYLSLEFLFYEITDIAMVSSRRLSVVVNCQILYGRKTFRSDLRFESINLLGDKTKGILERYIKLHLYGKRQIYV